VSEKTEPATDQKIEDARKKGQVPQSSDLSSSFAFAFATVALVATAALGEERLRSIITRSLQIVDTNADEGRVATLQAAYAMATDALWLSAPIVVAAIVGSLIGGFAHVGFNVSFDPLTPKFDKLDPVAGAKRIFSIKTLFEVFKSMVKAVFIGWMLYESIRSLMPLLVVSGYGQPRGIGQTAWSAVLRLLTLCAVLFFLLGVVDFVIQKLLFLKDQKMTKDEIKREYKQSEGDPLIKGQRRALAHELANSDPAPAVATANAVVVNPTHYAVALRYVPEECGLPVIVAKGVDEEAARIRLAAKEAGVPIIGNPELARALYKVSIASTVPEPLLEAVAIVLHWAEEMRGSQPAADGEGANV
jgi:type III secretion protein U